MLEWLTTQQLASTSLEQVIWERESKAEATFFYDIVSEVILSFLQYPIDLIGQLYLIWEKTKQEPEY